MRYIFSTLLVISLLSSVAYSQNVNPEYVNYSPFGQGEEVALSMSYSLFLFDIAVGEARFIVRDTIIENQNTLHLIGTGKSYSFYDHFFKVRDRYESWVKSTTLQPVKFKRAVDEGGYTINIDYDYNWKDSVAYSKTQKRKRPMTRDTIKLPPNTFDIVSVIYHSRKIDYNNLNPGDSIPVRILMDNKIEELKYCYKGIEEKKVKGMGKFRCFHFASPLIAGSLFDEGDEIEFWISNDKNRIPLWIESPIVVGSVCAKLIEFKNIKHPLNSEID